MVTVAILAALGASFGAGLTLMAAGTGLLPESGREAHRDDDARSDTAPRRAAGRTSERRALAVAGVAGLVALAVTHWPMSVPLAGLAVLGGRRVGGDAKPEIERLEAIASWTEMLRDTLAAAAGLTQALVAVAPISPKPLRPQLAAFAARLDAGAALVPALSELGEEIADPAADVVVATLVMAASERAPRLSDLLGALAESTREEVAMRLGIEASRASARTAVRTITGFSFGLLALMAVFARAYLAPYGSANGQLVLGAVGCLFGLGIFLMSIMVRPKSFERLAIALPRSP